MKITIFGAGYVGIVSAACLLRDGHEVTAVEPVASKVADINRGRTPITEPQVADMLAAGHQDGRLHATDDPAVGMAGAEMVWICVGTPSQADGGIDLSIVETAIRQIGEAIRSSDDRPLVVVRSTVLPGTTAGRLAPILEQASDLRVGEDVALVFHPEFLREGTAVADFDAPPKIVIGEDHQGAGDRLLSIYENYDAPRFRVRSGEAEMVKYCDNLFHAVKITFANEVGAMAKALGIDARNVADVFCADTKLNISPRYLRPGFAYGGSCLPKDTRAILRKASVLSLRLPMLEGLPASNSHQIESLALRLLSHAPRTVGMVGLAFKSDTDDMRESPYVTVAKRLIGEGVTLRIYDPGVEPERLLGSNKQAVQAALRHMETLLVSSLDELDDCDLIVVNHRTIDGTTVNAWLAAGMRVVDLAGVSGVDVTHPHYDGIAW